MGTTANSALIDINFSSSSSQHEVGTIAPSPTGAVRIPPRQVMKRSEFGVDN
jgi:hypothetical protein